MDYAKVINDALDGFVRLVWPMTVALGGVGLLTMSFLQVVKDLTPARRWFQRWWLEGWVRERVATLDSRQIAQIFGAEPAPPLAEAAALALRDLYGLATGGDARALYDLPVEQLAAQVNSAVQVVLDYPRRHAWTLIVLGRDASPDDLRMLVGTDPGELRRRGDLAREEQQRLTEFVDARNRVTHQIQRTLDGIQIVMGNRWKWLLQVSAVVLSGAFIFGALTLFNPEGTWRRHVPLSLLIAILGGFVAPFARDLVAALQSLRGRVR